MFEHGIKNFYLLFAKLLQIGKYGTFELSLFSKCISATGLVFIVTRLIFLTESVTCMRDKDNFLYITFKLQIFGDKPCTSWKSEKEQKVQEDKK